MVLMRIIIKIRFTVWGLGFLWTVGFEINFSILFEIIKVVSLSTIVLVVVNLRSYKKKLNTDG